MTSNYWQGSSVRLRAFEPSDAETVFGWSLDSERARLLDFVWPPSSLAAMQAWVEEASKRRPEHDEFHWVIEVNGCAVGTIGTHHCDSHNGTFRYGVDVAAEYRGRGYAGAAIRMVLRYFFEELRYQKVTVNVHADNPASIRLHEKLGFTREGALRRMFFSGGKYIDEWYYGLTAEEFQLLPPADPE